MPGIRTKQRLVFLELVFQCMRTGFLCPKCDNFACLHTRQDQNELHLKRWFFFFAKIGIFCKMDAGPLSETYTQPCSFGGRIKLIICQIKYKLSVTIYKISTSRKKTLDGRAYINRLHTVWKISGNKLTRISWKNKNFSNLHAYSRMPKTISKTIEWSRKFTDNIERIVIGRNLGSNTQHVPTCRQKILRFALICFQTHLSRLPFNSNNISLWCRCCQRT